MAGHLLEARQYLGRRFGILYVRVQSFLHVGMEVPQAKDFSRQSTQESLTDAREPIPTTPEVWFARQPPLSMEEVRIRRR